MLMRADETLSENHKMLYEFMYEHLTQTTQLTKTMEYEINVAFSGIVNARMAAKVKPGSSMYEAKVVSICEHVIYFLSNQALELESGEMPSRATKYQSTCLGTDLNMGVSKSSGGRRLDLRCRVGDLGEANVDLIRELHNIVIHRLQKTKGSGLWSCGQRAPGHIQSYTLPSTLGNLVLQFQSLTRALQVRDEFVSVRLGIRA
ncbi:MAG: hypothetical protein J3Q66DRAFT_418302 [Benniella sp.]|nr:MAG: hypothetical protein J3Q66DRAFT_418302 [Benniella sp.]